MADPTKPPGKGRTIKVRAGSALERLTQGQNFTDTVHEVFEMYARAIGDQPVEPEVPVAPQEPNPLLDDLPYVETEGQSYAYNRRTPFIAQDMNGATYAVPDPDTGEIVEVGYDEAMRLMKLQCPAGLEPVLDAFMIQSEDGEPEQEPFNYEQLA